MFLDYTPEGQATQRFHFQPGRLKTAEMIAIERRSGLKYNVEFKQALMQGSTVARQALLWTFLRRQHLDLRFEDVDFYDDELVLVLDRDETEAEIAALRDFTGISETDREAALASLADHLRTAPYAPGKEPPAPTPPQAGPMPEMFPPPSPRTDHPPTDPSRH